MVETIDALIRSSFGVSALALCLWCLWYRWRNEQARGAERIRARMRAAHEAAAAEAESQAEMRLRARIRDAEAAAEARRRAWSGNENMLVEGNWVSLDRGDHWALANPREAIDAINAITAALPSPPPERRGRSSIECPDCGTGGGLDVTTFGRQPELLCNGCGRVHTVAQWRAARQTRRVAEIAAATVERVEPARRRVAIDE